MKSPLVLSVLLAALLDCARAEQTANSDCTSFSSNGQAASNFQYYRFYDFRNITDDKPSSRLKKRSDSTNRTVNDNSWRKDWYIRDYPRKAPSPASIPIDFNPKQVYITKSTENASTYSTFLTLNTARNNESTQEGGEITYSEFNATACSIRVYARVRGASGAVAGIFTYQNDTQESDIEIFTRGPEQNIQYSNQPASTGDPDWTPIPGATVNNTLPKSRKHTDWLVHRLDWVPGKSVFFVNDEEANSTTLQVPVSDPPSGIYIDMWSANSTWSGSMDMGKSAQLDIQWVELLFNSTDSHKATDINRKVCSAGAKDAESIKLSSPGLRLRAWQSETVALYGVVLALMVSLL